VKGSIRDACHDNGVDEPTLRIGRVYRVVGANAESNLDRLSRKLHAQIQRYRIRRRPRRIPSRISITPRERITRARLNRACICWRRAQSGHINPRCAIVVRYFDNATVVISDRTRRVIEVERVLEGNRQIARTNRHVW
jgi:hypothetical protein